MLYQIVLTIVTWNKSQLTREEENWMEGQTQALRHEKDW